MELREKKKGWDGNNDLFNWFVTGNIDEIWYDIALEAAGFDKKIIEI